MDYYSTFQREGILTPAPAWTNLEDIKLSRIRQSLMRGHREVKFTESESRLPVGARHWGGGNGAGFTGQVQFYKRKEFRWWMVVAAAQQCAC